MFQCKIGGIQWRCSILFPAVLLVLLLLDPSGTMGMSVLAAVIHEAGHVIAAFCFRSPPRSITLSFYGMRMVWDDSLVVRHERLIVALAGPLINLISAVCCLCVSNLSLWAIHLGLGMFNLIPVFPLDGAVLLHACFETCNKGYIVIRLTEGVITAALFALGIGVLFYDNHNPTLLFVSAYMIALRLFYKGNCNV